MGSPWTLYPSHADSSLVTSQYHFHNCLVAPPAKIQRLECRYEVSSAQDSTAAAPYFPGSSNLNLHNSNGGNQGHHTHNNIPDDLPPLNYIGGGGGGRDFYPRVATSNNNHSSAQHSNGSRKRDHFRLGNVSPESTIKSLSDSYVITLREIPTWSIYYNDQKHRLLHFTGNNIKLVILNEWEYVNGTYVNCKMNMCVALIYWLVIYSLIVTFLMCDSDNANPVKPDDFLNRSVSLCFDEVCIADIAADAIVTSTTSSYGGMNGGKMRHFRIFKFQIK